MKHSKLFLTGMAALLLSFGLMMTGCDSGGGSDDPPPPKPDTSVTYRSTATISTVPYTFILEVVKAPAAGASIRAYTPAATDTFVLYAGPTASFGDDYDKVEGTVEASDTAGEVTTLTLTTDAADTITATISAAGGLTSLNGAIGSVTIAETTALTPVLPLEALGGATIAITGTMKSGSTLTAAVSAITPAAAGNGIKSYQWLRNGTPIEDATALEYDLLGDDVGATLKLRLTVLGYTGHVDSDATVTITEGFKLAANTYTVVAAESNVDAATKVHYATSTQLLTYFTSSSTTETLLQDTSLDKVLSGLSAGDTFVVDSNGLITAVTAGVTTAPDAAALTSVLAGVANSGTVTLGMTTTLDESLTVPANKTLNAADKTLGTSGTETVTINGTLISGTTASKKATLSGGVVITAGAAEANLAADGVVTVLGSGSTIDLASGASIKVEGNNASLIVGTGGATTTFVKATITATANAALTAAASTGAVNIGGTSVALANGGTITTLSTAALSAGDGTDDTALTLVTITAPAGGDTITGTAGGVLTIPASGIAFAAGGTAAIIGNGALVMGDTNKVTLAKATYTADASGGGSFAAGVFTMAVDDTLVLIANGKIEIAGSGKVAVGAVYEIKGAGAWTASGAAVTFTASAGDTGVVTGGTDATLTPSTATAEIAVLAAANSGTGITFSGTSTFAVDLTTNGKISLAVGGKIKLTADTDEIKLTGTTGIIGGTAVNSNDKFANGNGSTSSLPILANGLITGRGSAYTIYKDLTKADFQAS
ncbi:MAG: hypothetical protein LBD24_03030 [Spirochaetaceae bacterium]|jgi:hypothetical protein|nr:hypothetical protein [Spirochaetaceae bacterium]